MVRLVLLRLLSPFGILITHAGPQEHRGYCQRHEHHFTGDVSADGGGKLSRRARTTERCQISGALPRSTRATTGRERSGKVRGLFFVRGGVSLELHLH